MDEDFALLFAGAGITLAGIVTATLLQHFLSLRADRIKRERERKQESTDRLAEDAVENAPRGGISTPEAEPQRMSKFSRNLELVEGIGPTYGQKLKAAGIDTPRALLEQGASPKGRAEIAEKTGISSKLILKWVNQIDLFRIKGVGSEYADLLVTAGVDTAPELSRRNPKNLYEEMVAINEEKKLVRRMPAQSQVENWVEQAKSLPQVITYSRRQSVPAGIKGGESAER